MTTTTPAQTLPTAGHNAQSDSRENTGKPKKPPTANSRTRDARRLACAKLRGKALDDPGLAKTQANIRRTHDATYRVKHKKEITFKATLRLQDLHWKKHCGRPPPPTEKLDFTEQFQWFEEERWAERMPTHLCARHQQAAEKDQN
ncbi:hypothetical protein C8F04DRAFT_1276054 [Mycena alexandri]|uniref:Uncharacterized protein n=1 Tax=Mycena alexandri TaxID=1745969 RepID=A0AAD6WNS2_9AGAR|nr:hypothetical protein C8F04DRAFT_1276054 [Mycena alexandri]